MRSRGGPLPRPPFRSFLATALDPYPNFGGGVARGAGSRVMPWIWNPRPCHPEARPRRTVRPRRRLQGRRIWRRLGRGQTRQPRNGTGGHGAPGQSSTGGEARSWHRCVPAGALSPDRLFARSSRRRSTPPPTSGEGFSRSTICAVAAKDSSVGAKGCRKWRASARRLPQNDSARPAMRVTSPHAVHGGEAGRGGRRRHARKPAWRDRSSTSPRVFWGRCEPRRAVGALAGRADAVSARERPGEGAPAAR